MLSEHPELSILLVLAYVAYFGGVGLYVAVAKGRPVGEGFTLGLVAGPFGWLIVAMLPTSTGEVRSSSSSAAASGTNAPPSRSVARPH